MSPSDDAALDTPQGQQLQQDIEGGFFFGRASSLSARDSDGGSTGSGSADGDVTHRDAILEVRGWRRH